MPDLVDSSILARARWSSTLVTEHDGGTDDADDALRCACRALLSVASELQRCPARDTGRAEMRFTFDDPSRTSLGDQRSSPSKEVFHAKPIRTASHSRLLASLAARGLRAGSAVRRMQRRRREHRQLRWRSELR